MQVQHIPSVESSPQLDALPIVSSMMVETAQSPIVIRSCCDYHDPLHSHAPRRDMGADPVMNATRRNSFNSVIRLICAGECSEEASQVGNIRASLVLAPASRFNVPIPALTQIADGRDPSL